MATPDSSLELRGKRWFRRAFEETRERVVFNRNAGIIGFDAPHQVFLRALTASPPGRLTMSRRGGGQLPWGSTSGGGLYGGPGRTNYTRLGALALIALGALALIFFVFTKVFSSKSCPDLYCATSQTIAAPDGYTFASKIYKYNGTTQLPTGNDLAVRLPLSKATTDNRNLSFYQYVSTTKAWEPLTPATLDGQVLSATLHASPALIAVLRRSSPGGAVVAYLAPGATLNHDAVGKITILHTLDFSPAADGTIAGTLSAIKTDPSFQLIPVISARNDTAGTTVFVETILANPANSSGHVENIVKKVNDLKLTGIDIAYLDLTVNDRTAFTLFISELAQRLHSENKQLTLTIPAPIMTNGRVDEGAYDWGELGKSADLLEMMPYRDQSTYRQNMPAILTYLTSKVAATKLVFTVTPYATEKSPDGIRTMTLTQAMVIATQQAVRSDTVTTNTVVDVVGVNINKNDGRSGVQWQPDTATVAFTYEQNGGRTVWLENYFSVGFKLEYVAQFHLGGVAVEDASENDALGNIWTAILPYISSGQPVLLQPNPQDLQPVWQPSAGTIEDSHKGAIKWSTPATAGSYTIKLTLSDGVSLFQSELPVAVQAKNASTPGAGTPAASSTAGN